MEQTGAGPSRRSPVDGERAKSSPHSIPTAGQGARQKAPWTYARVAAVLFWVGIFSLPLFIEGFGISLVTQYLIFSLFALSVNLIWGYTGMFSFGQAAFFGWGAYTVGLLKDHAPWNEGIIALPLAMAFCALLSLVLGAFLFGGRRGLSGVYFAIVTLVVSYLSERLANTWQALGGYNGIPGIPFLTLGIPGGPRLEIFGGASFYYLAAIILFLGYLLTWFIIDSPLGLVLRGIRDHEERVRLLGYDATRVKLFVFVLSSTIAGLAGALYAYQQGFVAPSLLGFNFSTEALLWVAVGGRGTLSGPIVGTLIMTSLSTYLSSVFPYFWSLILGVILVAVILLLPGGVMAVVSRNRHGG